jgi:hypothetical protein
MATIAVAPVAKAQLWQPFIEPGYFNHDLQFFAPAADIDTYGGPVLRTGWFGSYSRMYMGVSRPEYPTGYSMPYPDYYTQGRLGLVGAEPTQGLDPCWGNRWDLGYMVDDVNHDHGWLFSWMHISGPNAGKSIHQQRLNRINEDDEGAPPPDEDDPEYVEPNTDRNSSGPPNRERAYDITDSLNVGKFNSLELNKVFRMEPLNHGGILEPFFGIRYVRFEDIFVRQDYVVYDDNGFNPGWLPLPPVPLIPPGSTTGVPLTDASIEDLATDHFLFTNDMFGGQLGLRWLKQARRWNLSSELRVFAMQNWQRLHRSFNVERTYYSGPDQSDEVIKIIKYNETNDWHANSTVVGTDIRAEAAYDFTRDVKLTFGMQYLGFYNGIGRGPSIDSNSQRLNMLGATFGIVVNR